MRHAVALSVALLAACGSSGTEPNTQILRANVEATDIPADVLPRLIGVIENEHEVRFPDGEGTLKIAVRHGRAPEGRVYLRHIAVSVVSSGGYEMGATLLGNATNSGTEEAPIHTRMVQISRTRSGLTGTSSSQMSVRVTPQSVEVL